MSQPAALGYFSWKQCSGVNDKFRYRLVSLDFLVSSRINSLKDMLCHIKTKEQEDEQKLQVLQHVLFIFFARVFVILRELVNLVSSGCSENCFKSGCFQRARLLDTFRLRSQSNTRSDIQIVEDVLVNLLGVSTFILRKRDRNLAPTVFG